MAFYAIRVIPCCLIWPCGILASFIVDIPEPVSLESLLVLVHWIHLWYSIYSLDHSWQCMKFNPLAIAGLNGSGDLVIYRIRLAIDHSFFLNAFWSW